MDHTREILRELKKVVEKRYCELDKQLTKIAIKDTITKSVPTTRVGGVVRAFTKVLLKIATRPVEMTSGLSHLVEYTDYKDEGKTLGIAASRIAFGAVFGGPTGLPSGCLLELMGGYLEEWVSPGTFFC